MLEVDRAPRTIILQVVAGGGWESPGVPVEGAVGSGLGVVAGEGGVEGGR